MTKLIKLPLYFWKQTKKGGWLSAPEGRLVLNPEVQVYMTANKVKHWELMDNLLPTQILMEIDE